MLRAYEVKYNFKRSGDVKYLGIIIEKDDEYSPRFLACEPIKHEYISTRA